MDGHCTEIRSHLRSVCQLPLTQEPLLSFTRMAPMEMSHSPKSSSLENLNLKVMDKALELPLLSSAYSGVTRIASPITPYVESTLTKVRPLVEAGYQTIKTQVEEKVVPHIPHNVSQTVSTKVTATMETVTSAVEKVDGFACSGIDQLTERVPQLKEVPAKLMKDTKVDLGRVLTLDIVLCLELRVFLHH